MEQYRKPCTHKEQICSLFMPATQYTIIVDNQVVIIDIPVWHRSCYRKDEHMSMDHDFTQGRIEK